MLRGILTPKLPPTTADSGASDAISTENLQKIPAAR